VKSSTHQIKTVYVVIFALLINAITSTGAFAALSSDGQMVLLCTSQGYEWVKVDSDTSNSLDTTQHCKLCLFPQSDNSVDGLVSAHSFISYDALHNQQSVFGEQSFLATQDYYFLAQGRAPPHFTLHT